MRTCSVAALTQLSVTGRAVEGGLWIGASIS